MSALVMNYDVATRQCSQEAGNGPGWDARYLRALQKHGLKLGSMNTLPDARYPQGWASTAPIPFDRPEAWPRETAIIYMDSNEEWIEPFIKDVTL